MFTDENTATAEEFDRVMAINARGVMLSYKYAALQMIQQGRGGRIIGIVLRLALPCHSR